MHGAGVWWTCDVIMYDEHVTCNMWSCGDDDVIICNEYIITCYAMIGWMWWWVSWDVMNDNMLECEWFDVMVFDN